MVLGALCQFAGSEEMLWRAGLWWSRTMQALQDFFLRHPDEVLSRTRICGHVWGEGYDFVSNTLDVHVKELRRALEARGPRLIQTVRGRGYLLGDPPPPAAEEGS